MELRPSIRLLALFGAVAIPPLVALAAVVTFERTWVEDVGTGTVLLLAVVGGAIWAAIVAVFSASAAAAHSNAGSASSPSSSERARSRRTPIR